MTGMKFNGAVTPSPPPLMVFKKLKKQSSPNEDEIVDEIDRIPKNLNFEHQHKILQSQVAQLVKKAKDKGR